MKTIRAFVVAFLLATPTYAADTAFHLSMVTAIAAHGADLATTEYCIGKGVCYEMNPFLARFNQPATFGAVKMGFAAGQLWVVSAIRNRMRPDHRWIVTIANFAVSGVFAGVAAHNAALTR